MAKVQKKKPVEEAPVMAEALKNKEAKTANEIEDDPFEGIGDEPEDEEEEEDEGLETSKFEEIPSREEAKRRELELIAEMRRIPKPPGRKLKYETEGKNYLESLTEEHWTHLIAYLYRTYPRVNNQLVDATAPNYQDKIGQSFNREYLVRVHGGGKYFVKLNDTENSTQRGGGICEIEFDIPITEAMPILDYRTLDLDHKQNASYLAMLRNKGILDENFVPVKKEEKPTGGDTTAILEKLINKLLLDKEQKPQSLDREILPKAMDMITGAYRSALDNAIKKDDKDEVEKVTKLFALFTQLVGKREQDGNIWERLLKMQEDNHRGQIELMKQMLGSKNQDDDAWLGKMTKFMEVTEKLGLGGGKGKGDWVSSLIDAIPGVLQYGSQIVSTIVAARMAGGANPNMAQYPPQYPQPIMQQGPMQIPQPPQQVPQVPQAGTAGGEEQNMSIDEQKKQVAIGVIQNYGHFFIQALLGGQTGDEFADSVVKVANIQTYYQIAACGKENLVEAIKSVPAVWSQVGMMGEKVERFVDEFVRYPEIMEAGERDEDDEDEDGPVVGVQ